MTLNKCTRMACAYQWQARVAKPKMCPRCHGRLDKGNKLGGRPKKASGVA